MDSNQSSAVAEAATDSRPYHHGNLRAALLYQAELIVREHGVEQLSLRDLARQVGVSHGAPRRHFADRQALLDALANNGFERLERELRAAAEAAPASFDARLEAVAGTYVQFAIADTALLELMLSSKMRDPDGPLHEAMMSAFSPVLAVIEQGQAEHLLGSGDPERVGVVLFASIQGIAALANLGMISPDELVPVTEDALATFRRGAAPEPARMSS